MKKTILISILLILSIIFVLFYTKQGNLTEDIKGDININDLLTPPAAADYYEDSSSLKVEKGTVTLVRENGETEVVSGETKVGMGDSIQVSADGEATIYWFDDSISRLQGETQITIDQADYNPENFNETDISFEVISGGVWSKVQNLVEEDSSFLSHSGGIIAGVRGTTYSFTIDDEGTDIENIRHAIFVGVLGGNGQVTNEHIIISGKQAYVPHGDIQIDMSPIEDIPEMEWKDEWHKGNLKKDIRASRQIFKKRTDQLKKRTAKIPVILKYLQTLDASNEKDELQAHLRLLQFEDVIFRIMSGKRNIDLNRELDSAREQILNGVLPPMIKKQILSEFKQRIIAADRLLDAPAFNERLDEARQILRRKRIDWEEDQQKRERLRDKFFEKRFYELYDLRRREELEAERYQRMIQELEEEMNDVEDFFNRHPELRPLREGILQDRQTSEPEPVWEPEVLRPVEPEPEPIREPEVLEPTEPEPVAEPEPEPEPEPIREPEVLEPTEPEPVMDPIEDPANTFNPNDNLVTDPTGNNTDQSSTDNSTPNNQIFEIDTTPTVIDPGSLIIPSDSIQLLDVPVLY